MIRRIIMTPLQPDRPTGEASEELGFRAQYRVWLKHKTRRPNWKWTHVERPEWPCVRGTHRLARSEREKEKECFQSVSLQLERLGE